jgi:predicted aspartyl protease
MHSTQQKGEQCKPQQCPAVDPHDKEGNISNRSCKKPVIDLRLNGKVYTALIDSGATISLINSSVANELKLQLTDCVVNASGISLGP